MSTLTQKRRLIGKQEFTIQGDGNLKVVYSSMWQRAEAIIPLCEIDPNHAHIKQISWQSLLGTILFLVPTVIFAIMPFTSNGSETDMFIFFITISVVFFMATFVCWRSHLKQYVNVFTFYSRRNGQSVINIWNELPNKEEFNNFVAEVTAKASESFNKLVSESKEDLASEILNLHKLKERGIIDEAEFTRAKSKLIDNAEPRTIGFR